MIGTYLLAGNNSSLSCRPTFLLSSCCAYIWSVRYFSYLLSSHLWRFQTWFVCNDVTVLAVSSKKYRRKIEFGPKIPSHVFTAWSRFPFIAGFINRKICCAQTSWCHHVILSSNSWGQVFLIARCRILLSGEMDLIWDWLLLAFWIDLCDSICGMCVGDNDILWMEYEYVVCRPDKAKAFRFW